MAPLLSAVAAGPGKPGFVEGHINISLLTPVVRHPFPREVYEAYRITIFKADGTTEVAHLTPGVVGIRNRSQGEPRDLM